MELLAHGAGATPGGGQGDRPHGGTAGRGRGSNFCMRPHAGSPRSMQAAAAGGARRCRTKCRTCAAALIALLHAMHVLVLRSACAAFVSARTLCPQALGEEDDQKKRCVRARFLRVHPWGHARARDRSTDLHRGAGEQILLSRRSSSSDPWSPPSRSPGLANRRRGAGPRENGRCARMQCKRRPRPGARVDCVPSNCKHDVHCRPRPPTSRARSNLRARSVRGRGRSNAGGRGRVHALIACNIYMLALPCMQPPPAARVGSMRPSLPQCKWEFQGGGRGWGPGGARAGAFETRIRGCVLRERPWPIDAASRPGPWSWAAAAEYIYSASDHGPSWIYT